jgi:hypothetical protein
MSTATGNVVVSIRAVDEASSTMDKIRASLGVFGGAIGELGGGFQSLGNVISGVAGAGVMGGLAAATGEVVRGLQDCFKAAKESEDVWNKLAGTVERSGAVWIDVKDKVEAFAFSAEKMSKFSDEQVAAALKTMMDYGMGLDEAMKSLATTMDLAAAKQIDLETAAKAVGRAFEGNASLLTRMGVEVTKSKDDSVVFADAMTKLQEKFGGAAQKDLETYAGKQALVANAMDNLKEKIGGALIPVLSSFQGMMGNVVKGADALVTDLAAAWKAFSEIPEVKKIAESLSGAWTDMQKGMSQVADELGKTLMPIFKELWTALGDVWKALSPVIDAFGEVWKAIVGVGKDGKEAYTIFNLLADVLKVTIVPAFSALVEGIKLVALGIKVMADAFKVGIETVLFWIDKLNEAFETIKKAAQGVSDFFTNLWNGLTGQTKKGVSDVTDEIGKGTSQITNSFDDLQKKLVSESIWPDMWGDMISQTTSGFDEILSETARGVGRFQGMFGGAAIGLAGPGPASPVSPAAVGAPSRTNVTVYSSVGTLSVGNKSELDDYLRQLHRTVVDAVRSQ